MIAWSFLVFGLGAVEPSPQGALQVGTGQPVIVRLQGHEGARSEDPPAFLELATAGGNGPLWPLAPGQTFHTVRAEEAGDFELRLLVGDQPEVVARMPLRVEPNTTRRP